MTIRTTYISSLDDEGNACYNDLATGDWIAPVILTAREWRLYNSNGKPKGTKLFVEVARQVVVTYPIHILKELSLTHEQYDHMTAQGLFRPYYALSYCYMSDKDKTNWELVTGIPIHDSYY